MHHLIISCHPNSQSFTKAIADTVEAVSKAIGHDTKYRDLYGQGFQPVLHKKELDDLARGVFATDVLHEQEFVAWADLLTLAYPIWWTGMPAMFKGYIDRVFSQGFAYRLEKGKMSGLLTGKKVLIFNTTGLPSAEYAAHGMHDAMATTTNTGIFELCGMEVIHHAFFGGMHTANHETRRSYLTEVEAITSRYL